MLIDNDGVAGGSDFALKIVLWKGLSGLHTVPGVYYTCRGGGLAQGSVAWPPPESIPSKMLPLRSTPYRATYPNRQHTQYQRPGTFGVDYDELGAEMGPNARVWHQYVDESDRMDGELVDGWNKTLDVMLIFAALFSAISTAFVIESAKGLKPDPAETSSRTLLTIAQTVRAISTGTPVNASSELNMDPDSSFNPPASMVVVNVLWFTSLSLSVAVSLVCILAKEWCYSFMAGRFGPILQQARLRHQRWGGIEAWKMKEILAVLPLLMHAALLLFAIGLSVYLLDMNLTVGLPVAIITGLATIFYVITAMLSAVFWLCPYTTSAARVIGLSWNAILRSRHVRAFVTWVVAFYVRMFPGNQYDDYDIYYMYPMERARSIVDRWIQRARIGYIKKRNMLADPQTPMDNITSSMLCWMITNCEDSRSVDLALQAIAGAHPSQLPRRPLWECNGVQLVAERLRSSLESIRNLGGSTRSPEYHKLLETCSLYSRSFRFLINHVDGEGFRLNRTDGDRLYFEFETTSRSLSDSLNGELGPSLIKIFEESNVLVEHCLDPSVGRADLAAFHLNSLLAIIQEDRFCVTYHPSRQNDMRWGLLRQHLIDNSEITLSQSALIALISGVTKSYLCAYQSCHDVSIIVNSLATSPESLALRRAVGICLAVVASKHSNYPRLDPAGHQARTSRVQAVYFKLTSTEIPASETLSLLKYGLISLLDCNSYASRCGEGQLRVIASFLGTLTLVTYESSVPTAGAARCFFDEHVAHVISSWMKRGGMDLDRGTSQLLCMIKHVTESPRACAMLGATVATPLIKLLTLTDSLVLKKACLRGLQHTLGLSTGPESEVPLPFFKIKDEAWTASRTCEAFLNESFELLQPLYHSARVATLDWVTAPYVLNFLWNFASLALHLHQRSLLWNPRRALSLFMDVETPDATQVDPPDASESRSTLSSLSPYDIDAPINPCGTNLMGFWITSLMHLYQNDPRGLLSSHLLDEMIASYTEASAETSAELHPDLALFTSALLLLHPLLESAEDGPPTWLQILRHLKSGCQLALQQQATEDNAALQGHVDGSPGETGQNGGEAETATVTEPESFTSTASESTAV